MSKLTVKFAGVNWKLVLGIVSVLAFALAGSADDPSPY